MKITKKQLSVAIVSILILVGALTFLLCDLLIPLHLWTHPILNFLLVLFLGFGITCLVLAIFNRQPWYFFISSGLLALSLFYIVVQYIYFWVALIIAVVFIAIMVIICFIFNGNKTENISLNKRSDYKDYFQRKAEEENEERMLLTPCGKTTAIHHRTGWAKWYLEQEGLLKTVSRGRYIITDEGIQFLKRS